MGGCLISFLVTSHLNVGLKSVNLLFLPVWNEKFRSPGLSVEHLGTFSCSRAERTPCLKISICQFCASLIMIKINLKVSCGLNGQPVNAGQEYSLLIAGIG